MVVEPPQVEERPSPRQLFCRGISGSTVADRTKSARCDRPTWTDSEEIRIRCQSIRSRRPRRPSRTCHQDSILIVALGDKSLGCCDQKTSDQQGRKDDSGTALSRLRGEQQHDLATNTRCHPGRTRNKQRPLQTFVAEAVAQHITTGKRNNSPCTASQLLPGADGLTRALETPAAGKALRGRIRE